MATVIRLVEYRDRRTRNVLKELASRAESGHVRGVLVCYVSADGVERFASTGKYRASRAEAIRAAARLNFRLLRLDEEDD